MKTRQHSTAIDAYHSHVVGGLAAGQRSLILDFIARRGGDWSIGELSAALDLQKSTVSARLNELLETGALEARPRRKDRRSGITIRPVSLPAVQMGLAL